MLTPSRAAVERGDTEGLPARIRIADYPALKRLAWQLDGIDDLAPADAPGL